MLIRMRTRMAGPELRAAPGEELTLDPDVARPLVDGGYAEALGPEPKPESKREAPEPHETLEGKVVSPEPERRRRKAK